MGFRLAEPSYIRRGGADPDLTTSESEEPDYTVDDVSS